MSVPVYFFIVIVKLHTPQASEEGWVTKGLAGLSVRMCDHELRPNTGKISWWWQ